LEEAICAALSSSNSRRPACSALYLDRVASQFTRRKGQIIIHYIESRTKAEFTRKEDPGKTDEECEKRNHRLGRRISQEEDQHLYKKRAGNQFRSGSGTRMKRKGLIKQRRSKIDEFISSVISLKDAIDEIWTSKRVQLTGCGSRGKTNRAWIWWRLLLRKGNSRDTEQSDKSAAAR
jgi:hypothetical protein